MKRALGAGARAPLVQVLGAMPGSSQEEAQLAGLLGALAAVYVPLEIRLNSTPIIVEIIIYYDNIRDLGGEKMTKVTGLGWAGAPSVMEEAVAMEAGRVVCRLEFCPQIFTRKLIFKLQGHRRQRPGADSRPQGRGVRQAAL